MWKHPNPLVSATNQSLANLSSEFRESLFMPVSRPLAWVEGSCPCWQAVERVFFRESGSILRVIEESPILVKLFGEFLIDGSVSRCDVSELLAEFRRKNYGCFTEKVSRLRWDWSIESNVEWREKRSSIKRVVTCVRKSMSIESDREVLEHWGKVPGYIM